MSESKNPRTAQEIPSTPFSEPECSPTGAKGPAPSPMRTSDAEAPACAICRQPIQVGSPVKELCCAHVLHASCADQWLRADFHCPICKTQVLFPVAQPDTRQDTAKREQLHVHAPAVVAVPLAQDGTDPRHYGVCRDCRQVFYRDPEVVRPDTLAWFRCPRCRKGDIRDLLRSSCVLM